MADFAKAFALTLGNEGTAFTNDKNDRGGPTKFGITLGLYQDYLDKPVTIEEMKLITEAQAQHVYMVMFWNQLKLDKLKSDLIAAVLFDQAVNRGNVPAVKGAQRALNTLRTGLQKTLSVAGTVGDITIERLNEVDEKKFLYAFFKQSQTSYLEIVKNRPDQLVYIQGWINRTYDILDLLLR